MPTLLPATGRDYKSAKDAKADYLAGKDFIIADAFSGGRPGQHCSGQDFAGQTVTLRFKALRNITTCVFPRS